MNTTMPAGSAGKSLSSLNRFRDLLRDDLKNYGVAKTINGLAFRAINRLVYFRILKCIYVSSVDASFLKGKETYTYGFLTPDQLFEFAKYEKYELSKEVLAQALDKGDECYAILDGSNLAAYGWYTNKPTAVSFQSTEDGQEDLLIRFSPNYIYMYKGFTHYDYRGRRLHAIVMTCALQAYLNRGFKGIACFVEAQNYASLKSCYRMGYKDFGNIQIVKLGGKYLIRNDRGCQEFEFVLEPI